MPERTTPESTRRECIPVKPIRLADGREWGFAAPSVRLTPRVRTVPDTFGRPVEHVAVEVRFGYPMSIQRLVDELSDVCGNGSVTRQYEAFMTLAVSLLRRAHDVTTEFACELLDVSDDELPRLVLRVMAIVSGVEPDGGPDT